MPKISWAELSTAQRSTNFKCVALPFENTHALTKSYNYSNLEWKDGIRKADNFIAAHSLILDVDGYGLTLDEAKAEFGEYEDVLIVTSKSHQSTNKINDNGSFGKLITPSDYFHIIIGLSEPITDLNEYKEVMTNLIEAYGTDPSCKDGARFYFGNPNQEYWYSNDQHNQRVEAK